MTTPTIPELEAKALWVRRKVLEMAVAADSGHVSTAMSQTEILVALYHGGILRHDPANPKWDDRDVFILSKGQGGIGLYPVLADRGYFPLEDLNNFCGKGSHIGVHAEWHCPGIEMISGSLGHGLPVATGIAQALKNDGKDSLVFCLCGDGELHEGSNWEAMMSAAQFQLSNLVLIIDRNGQNTIGRTRPPFEGPKDGPNLDPLRDKLEAFGFHTRMAMKGNDMQEVMYTLQDVTGPMRSGRAFRPVAIICNTVKGKGLSVMEDKRDWHYRCPRGAEVLQCMEDLKMTGAPATWAAKPAPAGTQAKHGVAMRDRYFDALYEHFQADKNCVLITADNGWPGIDKFAALKGQFFQVGIAEQQMIGMAAGLALRGRKVWCYAIAPFVTTRVHEFLKLDACAMNLPVHMVGPGAGFSYDIMCVTHHNVEDIAIMRALPNMTIYSPADGVTAAEIADQTIRLPGPSYVRLDRGGIADLHQPPGTLSYRNAMNYREGFVAMQLDYEDMSPDWREICIISTGVMTHRALEVAEALKKEAVVTILDAWRLRPFDHVRFAVETAGKDLIVTLEEHQLDGGLGSIVAEELMDSSRGHVPLMRIAVPNQFTFDLGGREAIHEKWGLDTGGVVRRVREWIGRTNSSTSSASVPSFS